MHKNIVAVTMTYLQRYIPENPRGLSFADLQEQIMANARNSVGDPFWMTTSEQERRYCVLMTALGCVHETYGQETYDWLVKALKAYSTPDRLPGILEECPDRDILPLITDWGKNNETE